MAQQKAKQRPKTITLQYLLKEDLPVWVRNNTGDRESGQDPGVISIQVGTGDSIGRVVIPPGSEPVCITDQVDPVSLRACRDLFQLIRAEALELLDPANAEEYYEANEERRAAMNAKISKYMKGTKEEVTLPKEVEDRGVSLHPKVGDICLKAKGEILSERDALERLIEQSKVLTEGDYQYIASNGHYKGVKAWAKEQLQKERLKGIDEDPIETHVNENQ
jgi:hypothetical protein